MNTREVEKQVKKSDKQVKKSDDLALSTTNANGKKTKSSDIDNESILASIMLGCCEVCGEINDMTTLLLCDGKIVIIEFFQNYFICMSWICLIMESSNL